MCILRRNKEADSIGSRFQVIPFSFYLINSHGPTQIHGLSLAKITGQVIDSTTNQSVKLKIRVGPSGGCIWSNIT
mgnify:CR=1 FL=1